MTSSYDIEDYERELAHLRAVVEQIPERVICVAEAKTSVTLPDGWEFDNDVWRLGFHPTDEGEIRQAWRTLGRPVEQTMDGGWSSFVLRHRIEVLNSTVHKDPQDAVDHVLIYFLDEYERGVHEW